MAVMTGEDGGGDDMEREYRFSCSGDNSRVSYTSPP